MKRKFVLAALFAVLVSLLLVGAAQADETVCYAVSGEINTVWVGTGFVGTTSGDLEGTFTPVGGPLITHGPVLMRPIVQTWEITGGNIEELIGETLIFDVDFRGIYAKPGLLSINNTARIIEGAQKGNLTQHGWTNYSVTPMTAYLAYYGVICP